MSAQSMEALVLANEVRLARADLKRRVKDGETDIREVLREVPEEVASMKVFDLLAAQHRWGRQRVLRLMRDAELSESKRLGELTERQRRVLIRYVGWA